MPNHFKSIHEFHKEKVLYFSWIIESINFKVEIQTPFINTSILICLYDLMNKVVSTWTAPLSLMFSSRVDSLVVSAIVPLIWPLKFLQVT